MNNILLIFNCFFSEHYLIILPFTDAWLGKQQFDICWDRFSNDKLFKIFLMLFFLWEYNFRTVVILELSFFCTGKLDGKIMNSIILMYIIKWPKSNGLSPYVAYGDYSLS